ncbi:cytochrome bd-I oxidase subunit CydX [Burkholderia sp. Bp8963]|nr:cytochrome bd-I oxidase subunit CydX [Burkholderia sp. Bp8963]RQS64969.1 cytochrome bd-I oxidase subunit CydX [Burkholderia sp. Bp8963]
MWYFSWILGIGVALGFGIINAMWLEAEVFPLDAKRDDAHRARSEGTRS